MPNITLPDGKKLSFKNNVTGYEVAEKISKSLSKQALIVSVDGELKDLSFSIQKDSSVKIITSKDKEGLDVIRHDAAHIMAMAVQELFPGTQVTIGPVIENGFFYDFARKEPFTKDDLEIFFKAEDFLWTIRCALHIFSKRANEVLSFDLQVPLAKLLGFQKDSGFEQSFIYSAFISSKTFDKTTFLQSISSKFPRKSDP